ncbi:MAG TPA: hypothetical protein VFU06_03250 [Longimicrobiales bacterium]|nr:hypothetical protein [Longimicrobiales bacterium]
MSKFAKGKSWIENRLADDLELEGRHFTANLLARKGTGVQGFRVSVVFIDHAGGPDVEAALPNAASTAEVHGVTRDLQADRDRLQSLLREASAAASG